MSPEDLTTADPATRDPEVEDADWCGGPAGPVTFAVRITDDKVTVVLDCPDPLADLGRTADRILEEFQVLSLPEYPDREFLTSMLQQACTPGEDVRGLPLIMGEAPTPPLDGALIWSRDYFVEGWAVDEGSGAMDFWEKLDNRSVSKDELLVFVRDPLEGEPGLSVFNNKIPVEKPLRARIRPGKGVREEPTEGGLHIHAAMDGRIRFTDGILSVDEVYIIKGNVSLETGNLRHTGTIQIEGDILEGATVEAQGDIIVKGMCEPCDITAGGGLTVGGGIVSEEKYRIEIGGDLNAKYIHDAVIRAEGDICVANEITHSDIRTRGRILVHKGRIAGGYNLARKGIWVGEAGAGGASTTVLVAGVDHTLKPRVKVIRDRIQKLEETRDKLANALKAASDRQKSPSEEDQKLLMGLRLKAEQIRTLLESAEQEIQAMTREALEDARQEVVMLKEVRSGTTIQLGGAKTVVRASILKPRIAQRRESRVRVLPLGEGNMPVEE
ncbi:MAG: FapA family protein [Candidatus Krumholzibacteriia bacterium]